MLAVQPPDAGLDPGPASPIRLVADAPVARMDVAPHDPGDLVLTCTSYGARMTEQTCKPVCRGGCFRSCSDDC